MDGLIAAMKELGFSILDARETPPWPAADNRSPQAGP
jgi:hypothetical protein